MSKVIMGNGVFYGCLIELQGVSAWWKETAQTRVFVLSPSLLLNRLEHQSKRRQTLTTHKANRPCRVRFHTFVGHPLRNSCKPWGLSPASSALRPHLKE